jgi:hypothetical protein
VVSWLAGYRWMVWVSFLAHWAMIGVIILATVFGILLARDNRRYQHLNRDIRDLRSADAPIGFSAVKNETQNVIPSTPTRLIDWTTEDGNPEYDASNGAFDPSTGFFTAALTAIFSCTGAVCFETIPGVGIREGRLVTNGAGAVPATVFNQQGEDNATTVQCLMVSQMVSLAVGERVWLEAFHECAPPVNETVSIRSRFSCERIGQPIRDDDED